MDFAGIVACTARQVADFVKTAKESGLLDNTGVVIVGDHLAMPNPLDETLKQAPERNIFNLFVGEGTPAKVVEEVLPFDMFPTVLQFIGVEVQGGRLALGYAAFADSPVRRSAQDAAALHDGVLNPSSIYLDLWRPLP